MENYFIERDTLEKFLNPLIAEKYGDSSPEEKEKILDENVGKLDDAILEKLLGGLTKSQLDEINIMFDQEENNPDAFRDFFKKAGIDVEETITGAVQEFGRKFLGGENA
ncbi:hypothetical protein IJS18_00930 [Candidatus Saccharibacteria bacterium]|nr:hypothetical protein [Candidatus Saccharibacteria bacterium]